MVNEIPENHRKNRFPIQIRMSDPIIAVFDTGATCSCINEKTARKTGQLHAMKQCYATVNQADGKTSLGPLGVIVLPITIGKSTYNHEFIVCKYLKTSVIVGLDFSSKFRIGIDWSLSGEAYLQQAGQFLVSCLTQSECVDNSEINQVQINTLPKCARLLTRNNFKLSPHETGIIPVIAKGPLDLNKTSLYDVSPHESFLN